MPIKLLCVNCHRSMIVLKADSGKPAMCNACGVRFNIPDLSAEPDLSESSIAEELSPQISAHPANDAAALPVISSAPTFPATDLFREPGNTVVMPPMPDDLCHLVQGITPPQIHASTEKPSPYLALPTSIPPQINTNQSGSAIIQSPASRLTEIDLSFPAAPDSMPENYPIEKPKKILVEPLERDLRQRKVPRFSYAGSFLTGFAGMIIGLLIGLTGYYFWTYRNTQWERDNRAEIMNLISDAETAQAAGNFQRAAKKYAEMDQLIGGQSLTDETLISTVAIAGEQKRKILDVLLEAEAKRNAISANNSPVVKAREPDYSGGREAGATIVTTDPTVTINTVQSPETMPINPKVVAVKPDVPEIVPEPKPVKSAGDSILHPVFHNGDRNPGGLSDEQVGQSIQAGVNWLIGHVDLKPPQASGGGNAGRGRFRGLRSGQQGGIQALCVYALLQSGMAIKDDRLDVRHDYMKSLLAALDAVKMEEGIQTYGHGIRATALALYNRREDRAALMDDVSYLLRAHKAGAYTYNEMSSVDNWDNSNSQYGLLGLWAAAEANVEISSNYWTAVQKHWIDCQNSNGAFGYHRNGETLSMTLAGTASLFVCHDYLESVRAGGVGRPPFSPALTKALNWLEQGDRIVEQQGQWGYTLYGVERVGLASGFKYFGKNDWYRILARQAISRQANDGSWEENPIETAYALLFLARGRHPIIMNKLRFDGYWANRPRDVANLSRFASREMERPLNFQIVSVDHPWTDWTDSPILYIASHEKCNFTAAQIVQFRKFVEAGGMIFTQADGNSPAFDQYARTLASKIFPQYEMKALPKTSLIYSALYKIDPVIPLFSVSNGSRELIVHSPTDISMAWQQRMDKTRTTNFQLGLNLFLYASGKSDLRNRIASESFGELPAASGGTIKLARLRYSNNWDPEPFAWERFAKRFQSHTECALDILAIETATLRPESAPVAVLTGAIANNFSQTDVDAIRNYVDGGGTLVLDNLGNSGDFAASTATLIARAFPTSILTTMARSHPIFSGNAGGITALSFPPDVRSYAQNQLGKNPGSVETLTHGKGRVIYLPLDLTSGLLGCRTYGILGYTSKWSEQFMSNVIFWVAAGAPEKMPDVARE